MMKKSILLIITSLLFNVKPAFARECSTDEIKNYKEEIQNVSYTLEYNPNYTDMNGNKRVGYFIFKPLNLPNNYQMLIEKSNGTFYLTPEDYCALKGGIYEVKIIHNNCDNIIENYQIKIPFYKQFCELEKECTEVWDDGTEEIIEKIDDPAPQDKVNKIDTKIIILAASVIIIITTTIIIVRTKRRKKL